MARRVLVNIFPRNKYSSTVAGKSYLPRDRKKFAEMAGSADRVDLHTRVYARDANVTLDFDAVHGGFSDELPLDGPRSFGLTKSGTSPALPYDGTSMPSLPDDGTFYVEGKMGRVEVQAKCAGAVGSVEFETWATLTFFQ